MGAGLALSTLSVVLVARWADQAELTGAARTVAIQLANVSAFAGLWLAQFVILDRVLFADRVPVRQDRPVPVVSR